MTKATSKNKAFKINADRIFQSLKWLKANNPFYFDIVIDEDEIKNLEKVQFYHEIEGANVKFID